MKLTRLFVVVAGSLWLAVCAVPRPPASAAAAMPDRWQAPLPHGGTLTDLRQWWQQFNDPLLIELIEAAQTVSPDVATAGSRIAQARAARVVAGAALLPTADFSSALARGNTQAGVGLATTFQNSAQAAWEIDLFGGNKAALEAAQSRYTGAQAGWHAARVAVAAEAANSYVALRTCERQLGVARNDARSRAETSRLTRLGADAGFTAPAVAALARASAAEASARATQQQAQCDLEIKGLVALTGLAEPVLRQRLQAEWREPERFALVQLATVPAAVLEQRPDVFQAAQEIAAASADVGTARAERMPQLSLTGQVGRALVHAGGGTANVGLWSIGPLAVSVPLFDAGRRAANEDAAQARYDEAVALYSARVRQAVREVETALVSLDSARARSEDARVAVEGYRVSFAATESRYKAGLASLIELEDQRRVTLAAETALVALQQERIGAWIALYRAVGGGWAPPAEPVAQR